MCVFQKFILKNSTFTKQIWLKYLNFDSVVTSTWRFLRGSCGSVDAESFSLDRDNIPRNRFHFTEIASTSVKVNSSRSNTSSCSPSLCAAPPKPSGSPECTALQSSAPSSGGPDSWLTACWSLRRPERSSASECEPQRVPPAPPGGPGSARWR